MIRDINGHDIEMFYQLERIKAQSRCIDKQVACIIADKDYNIIATGVNTIVKCDKNCHDKENRTCEVVHAERMAVRALSDHQCDLLNHVPGGRAYVSLFPCKACQELIAPFVDEIVTFGMIHKDWVSGDKLTVFPHMSYMLKKYNGDEKQRFIAMGELAELITAVSDFFAREDKKSARELLDEIFDAETQIEILKILVHEAYPEAYNVLREIRDEKSRVLMGKFALGGVSSYGISK